MINNRRHAGKTDVNLFSTLVCLLQAYKKMRLIVIFEGLEKQFCTGLSGCSASHSPLKELLGYLLGQIKKFRVLSLKKYIV